MGSLPLDDDLGSRYEPHLSVGDDGLPGIETFDDHRLSPPLRPAVTGRDSAVMSGLTT